MPRRRLMSERVPADLSDAVREQYARPPEDATRSAHLAMIAAEARASREAHGARSPGRTRLAMPPRLRLALTLGAVALSLPLAMVGLAVAGVKLPDQVGSAFESVGVELPNQADEVAENATDRARGDRDASDGGESNAAGENRGGPNASSDESRGRTRSEGSSAGSAQGAGPADGGRSRGEDGQQGAPSHSQQGGSGVGTPPPHAQDSAGGSPPHAQDSTGGPPPHSNGTPAPNAQGAAPIRPPQANGVPGGDRADPLDLAPAKP